MVEGRNRGRMRFWLSSQFRPFVDITRKYKEPRIKMTKGVRAALLILRLYLILMIIILVFKFVTTVG
jgi:hypothetical protein